MVRFLEGQGLAVVRVRGSHHVLERGARRTAVPVDGNDTLRIGTLRGILHDVEIGPAEFVELWRARG